MVEPFNLKEEREQGHFDGAMNFVFKKERGEVDSWVAELDEATMEQGIGETAVAFKVSHSRSTNATRLVLRVYADCFLFFFNCYFFFSFLSICSEQKLEIEDG